ncbi:PREDICTED: light-harvesting complex-like protein OHP1, chloroplastic [Lupinus angustifolius]|uniref:light-harvesting complex-like protein OHP1, chloroplastic n=1 Tax=Lupinus angustifolius TaxID=3871 RepID=UPI00092E9543|nr:PREDICTED: light-harvesting complex-like protein OHP1, chloroplastic [Lupinus angustifolius]
MATSTIFPSSLIKGRTTTPINSRSHQVLFLQNHNLNWSVTHNKRVSFSVQAQAAKPPAGVEFPKVEPQFKAPFLGFTKTAEVWNSRACMIGLIGTFIVELIINKGILQVIGVEIGKGLDLPL